jgi:hypothetical protein
MNMNVIGKAMIAAAAHSAATAAAVARRVPDQAPPLGATARARAESPPTAAIATTTGQTTVVGLAQATKTLPSAIAAAPSASAERGRSTD